MQKIHSQGLTLYQFKHLTAYPDITHAVTSRQGGVSTGPYDSLNLGFKSGDNLQNVVNNRRRVCEALEVKIHTLTLGQQVHQNNIQMVTENERGRGAMDRNTAFPETDALITQTKETTLMTQSADCPLILGYDPVKKVITAIHASWRAISKGIIPLTIQKMKQSFDSLPENIRFGVSPSIGPCCYEVKDDFIKAMAAYSENAGDCIERRQGKTYFNLWKMIEHELSRAGVKPEHIEIAEMCTSSQAELFYSYRRDGEHTGRFGALICQK